ncbi:serine/threonine protein kinase [Luteimonas sp. WGS1318]|uniref:serine/threonine protein kinase n=1 Tax=Luteimonas sp. WGS1318 TaxID=3366815 RepID=UPI00372D6BE5
MDPQDLKTAWQSLEARMARSDQLHLAVLRDTRLQRARAALRPLKIGHWLQLALGLGLIALGVACWTRNTDVPGLLMAGVVVHAFGVLNIIGATLNLALAARIDYAAPVLVIQRQLAALLRAYALNAAVCGAPWWILWLPVVVAFAGLGEVPAGAGTPAWITWSLAIGGIGLAGTWLYGWRQRARTQALDANAPARCADGADGIRRSQRLLAEIQAFETE